MSGAPTFETILTLCARKDRAWRTFTARQQKLGAIAHPATQGNEGLIHNWGNEAAKAVVATGWRRWRAYHDAFEGQYRQMLRAYTAAR